MITQNIVSFRAHLRTTEISPASFYREEFMCFQLLQDYWRGQRNRPFLGWPSRNHHFSVWIEKTSTTISGNHPIKKLLTIGPRGLCRHQKKDFQHQLKDFRICFWPQKQSCLCHNPHQQNECLSHCLSPAERIPNSPLTEAFLSHRRT